MGTIRAVGAAEHGTLLLPTQVDENVDAVLYADCDVMFIKKTPTILDAKCGSVVDLEAGNALMQYATMYWAVWAGSGILTRDVLLDLLRFVNIMYTQQYVGVLQHKRDTAPFVCDMTLWYLFEVVSSDEYAAQSRSAPLLIS